MNKTLIRFLVLVLIGNPSLIGKSHWEGVGEVRFLYERNIHSPWNGKLLKLFVKKGQKVNQGKKLFCIESWSKSKEELNYLQFRDQYQEQKWKESLRDSKEQSFKKMELQKLQLQIHRKEKDLVEFQNTVKWKKELYAEGLLSEKEFHQVQWDLENLENTISLLHQERETLSQIQKAIPENSSKNWSDLAYQKFQKQEKDSHVLSPFAGIILDIKKFPNEILSSYPQDTVLILGSEERMLRFSVEGDWIPKLPKAKIQFQLQNQWFPCVWIAEEPILDPQGKWNTSCKIQSKGFAIPIFSKIKMQFE